MVKFMRPIRIDKSNSSKLWSNPKYKINFQPGLYYIFLILFNFTSHVAANLKFDQCVTSNLGQFTCQENHEALFHSFAQNMTRDRITKLRSPRTQLEPFINLWTKIRINDKYIVPLELDASIDLSRTHKHFDILIEMQNSFISHQTCIRPIWRTKKYKTDASDYIKISDDGFGSCAAGVGNAKVRNM